MEKVRIFCKNTKRDYEVAPGTKIIDFLKEINYDDGGMRVLAAYVNHELKELGFGLYMASEIELLTYADADGRRTYKRSLSFLLQRAVHELFPDRKLCMLYNLPNGQYGELRDLRDASLTYSVKEEDVAEIKKKMESLVRLDLPIIKTKRSNGEARQIFLSHNQEDKSRLLESTGSFFTSVYYMDGYGDTFYGPMLASTGCLDRWDIFKYNAGFCLQSPDMYPPYHIAPQKVQSKLYDIFQENSNWCEVLGVRDIGTINKAIASGHGKEIVNIAEALHSRKYARIADIIYQKKESVKLVLIAGPSSSGKTTTSKRVALQLSVLGLHPVVIAMDDYFVDRELTPKDEKGEYDFESVHALNLDLLNEHLTRLFAGEEVTLPKFDFAAGRSTMTGETIRMHKGDILLMEGIHALNPELTEKIDDSLKFRIYASALTSLSVDENNAISTTDNRKLRRMVRDSNFRGTGAESTLMRWDSVVAGENKNIFPYQENADIMFNSSLIYELPMLKFYAEPLLRRISPASPVYAESLRLIKFLSYIVPLNPDEQKAIPPTSIMREFIGGSSFDY